MSSKNSANQLRCICGLLSAALFGLIASLLSGCGKQAGVTSGDSLDSGQAYVVATVNGVPINRDQMYSVMEQYVPAQVQGFPRNPVLGYPAGRYALQRLITNELTIQLAKSKQVPVTDDEVNSRYNDVVMVKDAQSTTSFEELLTDQGITVQQFKDQSIAPDVAQYNLLSQGITATDAELLANYKSHIVDYTEPDRVHFERIVLADKATADAAYAEASKSDSLDEVLDLNTAPPTAGGADTADVPQWFDVNQPPSVLTPVLNACKNAKPGTVLKPLDVQNQWWLIKLVDRKNKTVLPFDQVKHIIMWNVITNKAVAAGNLQKLQMDAQNETDGAVITVTTPQYISLVKQLQTAASSSPPTPHPAN